MDIKYIEENYLEWNDLCTKANISSQNLEELIDRHLIPSPSYVVEVATTIKSSLEDSINTKISKKYFPKNTVELVEKNRNLKSSTDLKESLKKEFTDTLANDKDNKYAYGNILDAEGVIDQSKLDIEFEKEWEYYLKGVYGICTLNNTGSEIAKKEMAVKKLIDFISKHKDKVLSENERETLLSLNDQYNEISNLFAPYQRESSSRGKYLDEFLRINHLGELIKGYD